MDTITDLEAGQKKFQEHSRLSSWQLFMTHDVAKLLSNLYSLHFTVYTDDLALFAVQGWQGPGLLFELGQGSSVYYITVDC